MNKLRIENRKALKLVLIIFIICLFFGAYYEIAFMKTKQTCGEITDRISGAKNHCYFKYSFKLNNKIYYSEVPCIEINGELSLESLKKIKCIKIEYSTLDKSYNRIVDARILR